jgi:CheY-like chemotaxis protein
VKLRAWRPWPAETKAAPQQHEPVDQQVRFPNAPVVLHVDDQAPNRLLVRMNLEGDGINVVEATDGVSGLEMALSTHPHLILMDVMHPGPDGFETAQRLKADDRTREIPLVFLTARAEIADLRRGFEVGAIEYVTKPFNALEVAPLVRQLLSLTSGEREEWRRRRYEAVIKDDEPAARAARALALRTQAEAEAERQRRERRQYVTQRLAKATSRLADRQLSGSTNVWITSAIESLRTCVADVEAEFSEHDRPLEQLREAEAAIARGKAELDSRPRGYVLQPIKPKLRHKPRLRDWWWPPDSSWLVYAGGVFLCAKVLEELTHAQWWWNYLLAVGAVVSVRYVTHLRQLIAWYEKLVAWHERNDSRSR